MNSQQNHDQQIGIGSEEQSKLDAGAGNYQLTYVSVPPRLGLGAFFSPSQIRF
jgi:hypothetical protein